MSRYSVLKHKSFSGKNIAVVGFGVEGETAAEFLIKNGAKVSIFDEKKENLIDRKKIERFRERGVTFRFLTLPDLSSFDLIIRSPGIRLSKLKIEEAQKKGAQVTSATKLFFDLCPCPIIGVTGTKGKGTTSTLIYKMLEKQGIDVHLGGNIGVTPLTFLDTLTPRSQVVLELSSFQLQDLHKSPHIAVMLMVTSEHLDYHKDVYEYVSAKRNILRFQTKNDFAVINHDYPASNESDILTNGQVYYVSREQQVWQGAYVKDGMICLKMGEAEIEVIKTQEILLPGKHNLENVCAALLAATLAGAQRDAILSTLKTFKGLEHRLELVATIKGVRYYDDSFSTTPETAIAAIEAFEEDPEILILGGSSKKSDFRELGKVISSRKNIKAIIGVGEEWSRIKSEIRNSKFEILIIENCKNMEEIVKAAAGVTTLGDVVLLSPGCASFGMFKNYKARGDQFKEEVLKLKAS